MNLNKVIICGRLTKDPELKKTQGGTTIVNMTVATSRTWTKDGDKQEQAEFHRVVLWGKLGDIAGEYLMKGQLVLIEGRLQTRSWEAKDGSKRYSTEIVGEHMQMGVKAANSSENREKQDTRGFVSSPEDDVDVKDIPF
ncbi:MAG: single-stranded DNA-binding protein [Parcubacteria group bacterium]